MGRMGGIKIKTINALRKPLLQEKKQLQDKLLSKNDFLSKIHSLQFN